MIHDIEPGGSNFALVEIDIDGALLFKPSCRQQRLVEQQHAAVNSRARMQGSGGKELLQLLITCRPSRVQVNDFFESNHGVRHHRKFCGKFIGFLIGDKFVDFRHPLLERRAVLHGELAAGVVLRLDEVGAFPDPIDHDIPIKFRRGILFRKAVAAVALDGIPGGQPRHIGCIGLAKRVVDRKHVVIIFPLFGRGGIHGQVAIKIGLVNKRPAGFQNGFLRQKHAADVFMFNDSDTGPLGIGGMFALHPDLGVIQSGVISGANASQGE